MVLFFFFFLKVPSLVGGNYPVHKLRALHLMDKFSFFSKDTYCYPSATCNELVWVK